MFPHFEERLSDSPLVERIWSTRTEGATSFTSISTVFWSMVISKWKGHISLSLHGPETSASRKEFPIEGEWLGIVFKLGTFVPHLSVSTLIDESLVLTSSSKHSFSLAHSTWEFPTYENADTFVDRLLRAGLLVHDPLLNAIHQGQPSSLSLRMIQYRFLRSTGLSQRTIRQVERARYAAVLLKQGLSILDTVYEAGYSDQAHLSRSLKHFIGLSPSEIPKTPIIALYDSA